MKNRKIYKITMSSMMIAVGLALPFLTGQVPEIGNMLLPMHLPVLLGGLLLGGPWGAVIGFITPLLRSLIFARPVMFPTAVAMAAELITYGLVVGVLYSMSRKKSLTALYISLVSAMVIGRLVWGAVMACLMGFGNFTFAYFITESVVLAVPGIILQLVLIPAIMVLMRRAHIRVV